MRWAVGVSKTSLDRRNVEDLLSGLGFRIVEEQPTLLVTSSIFDALTAAQQVWEEAKHLRQAFTGAAGIDPEFELGAVIDLSLPDPRRRHVFLEVQPCVMTIHGGSVTLTIGPPAGLSDEELAAWKQAQAEKEYQHKLEGQRAKLEPVYRNPKAAKVLELLGRESPNGEVLYKVYEMMEGKASRRAAFHAKFGVSKVDFDRFGDAVHNPAVSGDLARHAYDYRKPASANPMTISEAKSWVERLAKRWLADIREAVSSEDE